MRSLQLSRVAAQYLHPGKAGDFIFGGATPLSYGQVRRMCQRIGKDIHFTGAVVSSRFRTTILTDYYEETGDIKLVQQLAGHTTSAMTLEHYVRGRKDVSQATSAIERIYAQNVSQHGEIRKKSAEPQSPEV